MLLNSARLKTAVSLILLGLAAACTENLDNSAGCPLLCPSQGGEISTVTLDAVALDSTVSSLEGQGTEEALLLATRGDTIDSRAVIRFDSIPGTYHKPGSTDTTSTVITYTDSVNLRMRVDTVGGKVPASVTLDVYDVDTNAPDTDNAAVAALFTADRLITSQTFAKTALKDTISVTLPGSTLLAKKGGRLRLGIRARAASSVQLRLLSQEGAGAPTLLTYRISADTTVAKVVLTPYSKTPETQPIIAGSLADYTLLVKGTATGASTQLNVGGLPARRVYMRFNVPAFLIDSVDVVRATLLLNQIPNSTIDPTDTVDIIPHVSLATNAVTDVAKAAQIIAVAQGDTMKVTPGGRGLKSLEVAGVIGLWRTQDGTQTPRAIILLSSKEGASPLEARFYSIEASPELRPKLRISYSARKSTGLP